MKEMMTKQSYIQQLVSYRPRRREGEDHGLYGTGDLAFSNAFLLTEVCVFNTWFLTLMEVMKGAQYYFLSELFNERCNYIVDALVLVVYVWFATKKRKPPDKAVDKSLLIKSWHRRVQDALLYKVIDVEDWISLNCGIDIDIIQAYVLIKALIFEWLFSFVTTLISIEVTSSTDIEQKISDWNDEKPHVFGSVKQDEFPKYGKHLFLSQVVLSYSANMDRTEILPDDADCYQFAIDTCTTFHICKHRELFVNGITESDNLFVQGIGGKTKVTGYGTIKIRLIDDTGRKHDLLISNVLYVPESPTNLISPQKWSLSCEDKNGTGELTGGESTILFWDKKQFFKFIPHHPQMGIPIITVNDGFTVASAMLGGLINQPLVPSYLETSTVVKDGNKQLHVIPLDDDEDEIEVLENATPNPIEVDDRSRLFSNPEYTPDMDSSNSVGSEQLDDEESHASTMSDDESVVDVPKNELDTIVKAMDMGMSKEQKELLRIHINLKHLPFSYLKKLAKRGTILKHLEKVDPPLCPSCIMGKQHRRPWKGRGKDRRVIRKPTDNFPGAMTLTDQMISPFGGLIPQMKGRLMKAKFFATQIKVDHYTHYTYLHLMKDTTADSTLEAKNSYERLMQSFGHKVLGYHADNGRFAEKVFVKDCKDKAQKLTFCGVGSHHQNGIAERRIKSVSEDARTMLAHGHHLWPEVVTKSLWPYALKASVRARNKYHLDENGLSPEEKLSGIKMKHSLKHEHPLFCPVYVLDRRLQGGHGGLPKWNPRSSAGVYLGHSPDHSSDVALVLNLTTGLVSPQYHVIFDDTFSTVEALQQKKEPTNWENLCKFHAEDYRMDPFTNTKETSTELQHEVNEWLAGEGVDTVTDAEAAFDDIVVDELDGIENNLNLPLNDEPTQDSTA